jgi:uncharacterized protein YcaQ
MTMPVLSLSVARRIALAAQGFGQPHPIDPGHGHLRRTLARTQLFQIDSVNVLSRAHYLPAYSRLGGYSQALLDQAAWGRKSERRLFEYWAHEASLLPLELQPLLRWRMAQADRGEAGWTGLRIFAGERRAEAEALLARVRDDGPLSASNCDEGRSRPGWWEWGDSKQMLEWLFWAGHLTTRTRRTSFERIYDLPERVLPRAILETPTPEDADAFRALVLRSAQALGVATASDLRDYFRLGVVATRTAIDRLVEEGALQPVRVEGWKQPAYLDPAARRPRRIEAQALLAPFDPLIWERDRTERLFGFRYRIEIYVPAEKRVHGYYVLPLLLGDRIVARVDLKADRANRRLLVQSRHHEPGAPPDTDDRLDEELHRMASWLNLDSVAGSRAQA